MALAMAGLFVGVASAQDFAGTFTLPCDVQWDQAVLPAGSYTIIHNPFPFADYMTIRGEKGAAVMVKSLSQSGLAERSGKNTLTLVRRNGRAVVSSLRLGELAREFSYPQPKSEHPVMAEGPVLIQRIPISVRGK
jgi:hypothetical protein